VGPDVRHRVGGFEDTLIPTSKCACIRGASEFVPRRVGLDFVIFYNLRLTEACLIIIEGSYVQITCNFVCRDATQNLSVTTSHLSLCGNPQRSVSVPRGWISI
jgi:hypothetical protein